MNAEKFGIQPAAQAKEYEESLFDTSVVHTIDIEMDDWESFLETCTDEEYTICSVTIDGETLSNVAIRAKGNTSLSQVQNYGNDRYSFKIEFDHYDDSINYQGLDRLCLNNIIQDDTYMKDYAVKVENISKIYELKNKNNQYKKDKKRFYALKDVSFEIQKGDVVGILGTNGSGKSTLSLVLAGISDIDSGSVHVNGEQALISINTGLNQQLTGLENIRVKGALMGLKKKRIDEIIDDVVNFAELGDFLYQPVKKYSSGMKSRLGFSISLALNPDIFIVDEALSVGDKGFAKKCMDRMMQLRDDEGKTIFFVSHSLSQVKNFCKTGMWIEGGVLQEVGDINQVCEHYSEYVEQLNALKGKEKQKVLDEKFAKRLLPPQKKRKLFSLFN